MINPSQKDGTRLCLLVEDSKFDQERCRRIMSRSIPMTLVVASTLNEARAALAQHRFDLILLDNALPDGLGVDLAAEIRRRTHLRTTPILMVSDWPTPFVYDKAKSANIMMILDKDEFHPRHIRAAIAQA